MNAIEIDLAEVVVRARLLEDRAPRTCRALWDALPFGGRAVHAIWSGEMFRMLEPAPLAVEEVEEPTAFQYPGQVVFYPPLKELAICYGDARLRGPAGPLQATPVAEIEGDLAPIRQHAINLQWDGATPIQFRQAARGAASPARTSVGTRIAVELDDVLATAILLEDGAPGTCAEFLKLLPLEGRATNTVWSGAMTRFWGPVGPQGHVGLEIDAPESGTQLHWPGYVYYYPAWRGIRLCYGQASMSGPFSVATLTPLARFDGDWSAFRDKAAQLNLIGARRMAFRLAG